MSKLTKSFIDRIPLPKVKPDGKATQLFYRDDSLPGFGLRVGSGGTKTFFVERRIRGRVKRISIGRYGHLTPTQARIKAQELLGEIAIGGDPQAKKKAAESQTVTLQQAFSSYLDTRKELKPGTIKNYTKCVNGCLEDWLSKRLVDISKEMVEKRHKDIGVRAPARANNTMRVLRAIFTHAIAKYEDQNGNSLIALNPVDRLSQSRAWYPNKRRRTLLEPHELSTWYKATQNLSYDVSRDFLQFLLFTGLRKMEAATLTWEAIDFSALTIKITDTKNSEPHTLPITPELEKILSNRFATKDRAPWVFPSPMNHNEHIKEPRGAVMQVGKELGKPFKLHDLRRTFITIAESLDIPAYALKRLLNHKNSNDVTAGYIISNIDRLREPMQMISQFITDHIENG